MKIALIGYGAMGQLIAAEAKKAGDEIDHVATSRQLPISIDELANKLRGHDVVIDFSIGEAKSKHSGVLARRGADS
jgi:ketopantoate reductase